jgi:hypothetical protein
MSGNKSPLSSSHKLVALVALAICLLCVTSVQSARPPINANFVNGPWARIGKRTNNNEDAAVLHTEDTTSEVSDDKLCRATLREIENMDAHVVYAYYMRCMKGDFFATMEDDSSGRLFIFFLIVNFK